MTRQCSVCRKPCDDTNGFTMSSVMSVHFDCFDGEIAKTPEYPVQSWFRIVAGAFVVSFATVGCWYWSLPKKSVGSFLGPFLFFFVILLGARVGHRKPR